MPRLRDDDPFQHPALLAKDIATIDRLSGGRVELGIGAGWDFSGHYYSVKGLEALPRCSQQPPPILLGAAGPRMLDLAGQSADIVGLQSRMGGDARIGPEAVADLAAPSLDSSTCNGRLSPHPRTDSWHHSSCVLKTPILLTFSS